MEGVLGRVNVSLNKVKVQQSLIEYMKLEDEGEYHGYEHKENP